MDVNADNLPHNLMSIGQFEMLRTGMPCKRRPGEATVAEDDGVPMPWLVGREEGVGGRPPAPPLSEKSGGNLLRVATELKRIEPQHQEPVGTETVSRVA